MNDRRKPVAFSLPGSGEERPAPSARRSGTPEAPPPPVDRRPPIAQRAPRAVAPGPAIVTPAATDVFEALDPALDVPPPPVPRRRSRLSALFFGGIGVLVSLALGLWTEQLVRDLFARTEWLGWVALAAAAVAGAALLAIVTRELMALSRLSSIAALRADAADALQRNDAKAARAVVGRLLAVTAGNPRTAAGRRALAAHDEEIVDGADLVRIAERELLTDLDRDARRLVLDAAKRVSVVTAVSPRAAVDLAYVAFESARLIRRLSELYGGRPGTLGFFRLARNVLAHLAVTGAIAAGDEVVHQIVGQGLAARLSAKLGEGVVNGMMTARIGVAAMDVTRPLPFAALARPRLADFLPLLASFSGERGASSPRT
jgi:putative membrane protein